MAEVLRPADENALRRLVWALLGAGLGLRLLLTATTDGSLPDLAAFRHVHDLLGDDTWNFYSRANPDDGGFSWPYLPGFLPVLEAIFRLADATGIGFDRLIRVPAIAADLAIAWVVQWHMGWRGATLQQRLIAVALLTLGPIGLLVTGAHGQVEPVQWLPAVLALVAWDRMEGDRRALVAGALVGVGLAIKPPAVLVGVALFVLAGGLRERVLLVAAGTVVPLLVALPFLLADPGGVASVLDYQSLPGQGGLSLIVQPGLAAVRFAATPFEGFNAANDVLQDIAPLLVAALAGLVAFVAWRRKPDPATTVAALAIAVFVASPNFLTPYLIWLLPFALLAGWWRFVLAVSVVSLALLPFKYAPVSWIERSPFGGPNAVWEEWFVNAVYVPASVLLWALLAWRLWVWLSTSN